MLLNSEKELNANVCSNMNESQKHYAEGKKQGTREYMVYEHPEQWKRSQW